MTRACSGKDFWPHHRDWDSLVVSQIHWWWRFLNQFSKSKRSHWWTESSPSCDRHNTNTLHVRLGQTDSIPCSLRFQAESLLLTVSGICISWMSEDANTEPFSPSVDDLLIKSLFPTCHEKTASFKYLAWLIIMMVTKIEHNKNYLEVFCLIINCSRFSITTCTPDSEFQIFVYNFIFSFTVLYSQCI